MAVDGEGKVEACKGSLGFFRISYLEISLFVFLFGMLCFSDFKCLAQGQVVARILLSDIEIKTTYPNLAFMLASWLWELRSWYKEDDRGHGLLEAEGSPNSE